MAAKMLSEQLKAQRARFDSLEELSQALDQLGWDSGLLQLDQSPGRTTSLTAGSERALVTRFDANQQIRVLCRRPDVQVTIDELRCLMVPARSFHPFKSKPKIDDRPWIESMGELNGIVDLLLVFHSQNGTWNSGGGQCKDNGQRRYIDTMP